jgi:hypothetical protein
MNMPKEFNMKIAHLFLVAIVVLSVVAATGCRKEDASPVYNYQGGAAATNGEDIANDEDVAAEGDATKVNYRVLEIDCAIPSGVKGFITSDTDLDEFWMQQCHGMGAEPNIDFNKQFLAYYAAELSGCTAMEIKKIGLLDDKVLVGFLRSMPPPTCDCTKNPYIKRFFIAVDQVLDATPKFAIYADDKDCTPVE